MSWNPIDHFRFDTLEYPWMLLALIGVLLLLVAESFARAPGAMSISTGGLLARLQGRRFSMARFGPPLLRALGLAAMVVAMAGPLHGFQVREDRANVIDIALCVDVSGSMRQEDFVSGGIYRDRLYVTKEAVRDFIDSRRDREEGRYGMDRLGLILYAGYAWTGCPLTLDYDILEHELDLATVDTEDKDKDGTAIGSAIGLGVQRLRKSEAKSKVIVLLTDGINNRGEIDPLTAAELAKEYDIRVYTIGAGSTDTGVTRGRGLWGTQRQPIDEDVLKEIAGRTGAKYYRATDLESLQEAYTEINELETTEIEIGDYYEYKIAIVPWVALGAMLLLASVWSRRQWFESIP